MTSHGESERELAVKRAEVGQRSQLLRDVANELDIHHRDFARIVAILDWWQYEGGDPVEALKLIRNGVGESWWSS